MKLVAWTGRSMKLTFPRIPDSPPAAGLRSEPPPRCVRGTACQTRKPVAVSIHSMPGMNGADLVNAARRLVPDLPVLLASGYADLPAGVQVGAVRLGKPYTQDSCTRSPTLCKHNVFNQKNGNRTSSLPFCSAHVMAAKPRDER
jgi:hypothetical protein